MKKTVSKVKNYTNNITIVDNNNLQTKLFRFLIFSFVLVGVSYSLVIGSIVFNIVERQNLNIEIKNLSNEVAGLKLEYLAKSNNIDLELSKTLGFREVKANFAVRKSISLLEIASNEL